MPSDGVLHVGQEVSCSAHGNPEPMIELDAGDAQMPQIQERAGKRYFTVPKSWQGEQVRV